MCILRLYAPSYRVRELDQTLTKEGLIQNERNNRHREADKIRQKHLRHLRHTTKHQIRVSKAHPEVLAFYGNSNYHS